jgi:DNA-binding MarR family transcriptional regulator
VQLAEEIRYLLLAVQREGNRMLSEALRPLDLTPAQAEVLRVLQDHQPLSLVELGELLVCEQGSPSRLVAGMVTAGLVERVPSSRDGRYITLTLTKRGQQLAGQVAAIEAAMYQTTTELIKDTPVREVMDTLWRFVEGRPAGEALARRMRLEQGTKGSA